MEVVLQPCERTVSEPRVWDRRVAMPAWLASQVLGKIDPNGTFLIPTRTGNRRVHASEAVVSFREELFAGTAAEIEDWVGEQVEAQRIASRAALGVGPGKSMREAIPKRRKRLPPTQVKRSYAPAQGTPPSIEWVAVSDLQVDDTYQRSIESDPSQRLIATIAMRWDWRLCMPLAVSRRDAEKFVIDGQHRLAAARLRGDIPHLPCCLATYEGAADEAAMFVAANRVRRAINRLDDFHAALVAGDEDAVEVERIVKAAGLRVSRQTGSQSWRPGEVAFTSSIQTVLNRHGERLVLAALTALAQAFSEQVLNQGASLFLGLTRIMVSPPENLDRKVLAKCLQRRQMEDWGLVVKGAKGGDIRAQLMRHAILEEYQKCQRSPEERLAA